MTDHNPPPGAQGAAFPPVHTTISPTPLPPHTQVPPNTTAKDYCVLTLRSQGQGQRFILPDGTVCFRISVPGWLRRLQQRLNVAPNPLQEIDTVLSEALLDAQIVVVVPRDKITGDVIKALETAEALADAQAQRQAAPDGAHTGQTAPDADTVAQVVNLADRRPGAVDLSNLLPPQDGGDDGGGAA